MKTLLIGILLLAVLAGGFVVLRTENKKPSVEQSQTKGSYGDNQAVEGEPTNPFKTDKPPIAPASTEPSTTAGTIEIANVFQEGSNIVVQTKIIGAGDGQCTLKLSKESKQIEKVAEVIYQSTYSICAGFSVSVNELSEAGVWGVELVLDHDGKQSVSLKKEVTVVL